MISCEGEHKDESAVSRTHYIAAVTALNVLVTKSKLDQNETLLQSFLLPMFQQCVEELMRQEMKFSVGVSVQKVAGLLKAWTSCGGSSQTHSGCTFRARVHLDGFKGATLNQRCKDFHLCILEIP